MAYMLLYARCKVKWAYITTSQAFGNRLHAIVHDGSCLTAQCDYGAADIIGLASAVVIYIGQNECM